LDLFDIEKDAFYIMDKGYFDFERLFNIEKNAVFLLPELELTLVLCESTL